MTSSVRFSFLNASSTCGQTPVCPTGSHSETNSGKGYTGRRLWALPVLIGDGAGVGPTTLEVGY
jgi:hypothetical protein